MTRPAFADTEYARRVAATKRAMAEKGVDLLISADPANMNYLTGFDSWSFYVPQAVLVHVDHEYPWWAGRGMDANAAKVTTTLPHDHIVSYADHFVHADAAGLHPMDWVAEFINDNGWGGARIGVEMNADYFTAAAYRHLRAGLPDATWIDANLLVNWVRVVKSDAEVAMIRRAGEIIAATMRAAYDFIEPGVRQCDAAAHIYATQIGGTPEFGGEYTAIAPMLPTGVGTSTPHLTWSDEPFRVGEATILELAASHRRYQCPMARTLHLGAPPQKLADTAAVVEDGMAAALGAIKPGVTAQEIEAVWRGVISRHGIKKESRIGYSIGVGYPPDWGEQTISFRPGDTSVLQANNCFHTIYGIWLDDWGLEISQAFRVTETGIERFYDFPTGLHVKD